MPGFGIGSKSDMGVTAFHRHDKIARNARRL